MVRRREVRSNRRDDDDEDDRRSSRRSRGRSRDRDHDDDRGRRRGRGSKGGRFKYQKRSAEDARARQSESGGANWLSLPADVTKYQVKDGKNTIRILPPTWDDASHCGVDAHVHYRVGPNNKAFLCNAKHNNGPCPVCEEQASAREEGDDSYAQTLRPKHRTLYYIIDRDNEKAGVQVFDASWWAIDKNLAEQMIDEDTGEVIPFDDPDDGYDVSFVREKTGKAADQVTYSGLKIARHPSPLGRKADEWMEVVVDNPIPELLKFHTYDQVADEFAGGKGGGRGRDDDDDDDDDRPSRSRSKLTYEQVMDMGIRELEELVEDMDLDVNEEIEDAEELAEEVAKALGLRKKARRGTGKDERGSRRRRGRDEDEDEDDEEDEEDEDDEDEDEDERFSRTSRRRGKYDDEDDDEDEPRRRPRRGRR